MSRATDRIADYRGYFGYSNLIATGYALQDFADELHCEHTLEAHQDYVEALALFEAAQGRALAERTA